jgi:hypothetical protein
MYDDLGEQAAGIGVGDKRPHYVIQILPAAPAPAEPVQVIKTIEGIEVLPAPKPVRSEDETK